MPEPRQSGWQEYRHDSGETLAFRVVRSARKTLALCVNRDGTVILRLPLRLPYANALLFLRSRWDWLQKHRERFSKEPAPKLLIYRDGETFLHLGEPMWLCVRSGQRQQARQIADELVVTLTPEHLDDAEALAAIIGAWQRREAQRIFPQRLAFCHEAMHLPSLPFPELKIRKMRSRWGSCSQRGVVTLNLELVRMPLACIDYVATHELCHLMEFNHSPRFYELQSQFLPDWRERRQRLNGMAREQYGL